MHEGGERREREEGGEEAYIESVSTAGSSSDDTVVPRHAGERRHCACLHTREGRLAVTSLQRCVCHTHLGF